MISKMIFSKYSNNRKNEFQIVTSIYENKDGCKWVEKRARHPKAQKHINNIVKGYALLCKYNNDERVKINTCIQEDKAVKFKYIQGKLLSDILTDSISRGDYLKFIDQIKEYAQLTKQLMPLTKFEITREFVDIFGEVRFTKELEATTLCNIDFTFDNIIINEVINVIDYEWVFEFPIPVNYIIYRAINVYRIKQSLEEEVNLEEIFKVLEITDEEIEQYTNMEFQFQKYVNREQREIKQPIRLSEILSFKEQMQKKLTVQVFNDYGNGFSEENSFRVEAEEIQGSTYKVKINTDDKLKTVRIDPSDEYCMMQLNNAVFSNGIEVTAASYITNGIEVGENLIFLHQDPQVIFNVDLQDKMKTLEVTFKLEKVTTDTVRIIQHLYAKDEQLLKEHLLLQQKDEILKVELQQIKDESQILLQKLEAKEEQLTNLQRETENKILNLDNKIFETTNRLEQTQRELQQNQQELQQIKDDKLWKMIVRLKGTMLWKIIKKLKV